VQITRTTPLRRMILQLRQIFFTDANTFMSTSLRRYFARKMIRARDRSYGVRSTVTLSPGNILM
jgi:hypothetical protein